MAGEIATWVNAALAGASGGLFYWIMVDRWLGLGVAEPGARALEGTLLTVAALATWRMGRRP